MKKLGREINSQDHWDGIGSAYAESLQNDYHAHRNQAIRRLIPAELRAPGMRIFDFGCGDAVHFPWFVEAGAHIEGIDISEQMIALAQAKLAHLGLGNERAMQADVNHLKRLEDASFDAVISFNVLAYLSDEEERIFYTEVSRIVKPGGFLVTTHSNELFDVFSLNRFTVEFFKRHFVSEPDYQKGLSQLLSASQLPESPVLYNIRENPLTYRYKLEPFGFTEVRQEFINRHDAPPPLLAKKDSYPSTDVADPFERWKLMFTCSTYGSCATRR